MNRELYWRELDLIADSIVVPPRWSHRAQLLTRLALSVRVWTINLVQSESTQEMGARAGARCDVYLSASSSLARVSLTSLLRSCARRGCFSLQARIVFVALAGSRQRARAPRNKRRGEAHWGFGRPRQLSERLFDSTGGPRLIALHCGPKPQ